MKMFVEPSEVFLHRDFVDFRKSINGLVSIVEDELVRDAYTGTLFVFCNKAKDKLKIIYWDKTGFARWYKRLEKQKFKWPSKLSITDLTRSFISQRSCRKSIFYMRYKAESSVYSC